MPKRHFSRTLAVLVLATTSVSAAPEPRYAVTGQIAGPDGSWDYASVDAASGRLFVARGNSVTAIDLATGTARSIGTIVHGHAVVPIPNLGLLLVTSGNDDSVRLIDPTDGRETTKIAVGRDPDAAFYDAAGHRAVVMNAKAGTVSVIDVKATKVTRTIRLKPGLEFGAVGPGNILYVNNEETNEIETANLSTGVVGKPIALTGCEAPSGLAFDARSNLLISACANGKAAAVSVKGSQTLTLLDIGKGPDAVILDVARRVAFIPCGQSGTLSVISLAGNRPTVVGTVATELGAKTGALDLRDGTLYLPTVRFSPPTPPATRPNAVPSTFHVLIVRQKIN